MYSYLIFKPGIESVKEKQGILTSYTKKLSRARVCICIEWDFWCTAAILAGCLNCITSDVQGCQQDLNSGLWGEKSSAVTTQQWLIGKVKINENKTKQAVREAATICPHPCKLTFNLESGVRVTCDVAYLCANFSLPRPLCSRLMPDVCDRQTDVRCASSLNASTLWGRGINMKTSDRYISQWYFYIPTYCIFILTMIMQHQPSELEFCTGFMVHPHTIPQNLTVKRYSTTTGVYFLQIWYSVIITCISHWWDK